MSLWVKPLGTLAIVALVALCVWPIAGLTTALGVACAILAFWLAHHLYNLSQFREWLQDPRIDSIPSGTGSWENLFSYLLRMRRRQMKGEARIQDALGRFQKASAAMPDAVVILAQDNRIEWCNPKAEGYFGIDLERDSDQQITYFIRQPQFFEYLQRADYASPLVLRLGAGASEVVLSVQVVPYGDSEKLLLGRDITRWERLETTRRDFVANVSHELRTPLTVLAGFLETLSEMKKPDPATAARFIELMSQQTSRMTGLVEDLLTLSRLENTVTPLREEDVDIVDMVKHLQQDALALSNGKHQIVLTVDADVGLHGSASELRSAFSNLVSNAVRYTPADGRIEICWYLQDDKPTFAVADTGIGVEAHHIDRLTERFYRVDRSRSRETGGTGLGLAIVKHVLSRHQARLEIESTPGEGSVFAAVFPAERAIKLGRKPAPKLRDESVEAETTLDIRTSD